MQTVGPQALTVGATTTVPDPAQAGGNPSRAVQIQNSSPYQLNVNSGAEFLSIQPFFAQTVEIPGAPITVQPLTQVGVVGACLVTFAFLLGTAPGEGVALPDGVWVETPPQQDGPLTAQAIAAALTTQGVFDFLGSGTATATANFIAGPFTNTLHSYQSLLVQINPSIAGEAVTLQTIHLPTGAEPSAIAWPPQVQQKVAASPLFFVLPVANAAGDSIEVSVAGAVPMNWSWSVYGVSAAQVVEVTVPPGTPLPVVPRGGFTLVQHTFAGAGSAPILAAPLAGQAYRLQRYTTTGPNNTTLTGSGTGALYAATPGTNNLQVDNCDGLLAVEGLTVTTGAACTVALFFDTIPVPAIN